MGSGKFLLFFFAVLFVSTAFGHELTIFPPFREGRSNTVQESEVQRLRKKYSAFESRLDDVFSEKLELIETDPEETTYEDLLDGLDSFFKTEFGKKFQTPRQKRTIYQHSLILLRGRNVIDDVFLRLLTDHVERKYPLDSELNGGVSLLGPGLTLKNYLEKKRYLIKANKDAPDLAVSDTSPSPFPLKRFRTKAKGYANLTVRERIFYLYTPTQMKRLASIMKLALSVADAKEVFTTVKFRDDSEALVIEHSPTEQYRLALRLMRMKKREAESEGSSIGFATQDLDLIGCAYELGIISYEELSLIVHNKDFYSPEKSFASKVAEYIANLGLLVVRVNPVTAPYAIIPMLIYNTYQESKTQSKKLDEDSFFFELPNRSQK